MVAFQSALGALPRPPRAGRGTSIRHPRLPAALPRPSASDAQSRLGSYLRNRILFTKSSCGLKKTKALLHSTNARVKRLQRSARRILTLVRQAATSHLSSTHVPLPGGAVDDLPSAQILLVASRRVPAGVGCVADSLGKADSGAHWPLQVSYRHATDGTCTAATTNTNESVL